MTVTRLTVPQAAARLGVSERTLWRRIRARELSVERDGRRVLVRFETAYPERPASAHQAREAALPYDGSRALPEELESLVGPWPFSRPNLERRYRQILARRESAVAELVRLAAESRPDPEGLTVVDYLRPIRDPDPEPRDRDDP